MGEWLCTASTGSVRLHLLIWTRESEEMRGMLWHWLLITETEIIVSEISWVLDNMNPNKGVNAIWCCNLAERKFFGCWRYVLCRIVNCITEVEGLGWSWKKGKTEERSLHPVPRGHYSAATGRLTRSRLTSTILYLFPFDAALESSWVQFCSSDIKSLISYNLNLVWIFSGFWFKLRI